MKESIVQIFNDSGDILTTMPVSYHQYKEDDELGIEITLPPIGGLMVSVLIPNVILVKQQRSSEKKRSRRP